MMHRISRVAARSLRTPTVSKVAQPRLMSTIINRKERFEEEKFIRDQETRRKQELERILALEDSHEDKQDLLQLIEKKSDEEKGLLSKLGLDDWKFALPIGMLVGIPALANEVIILDAELQLTGCFILFCSTMYTQVGPMIGKALDDYSKEVENNLKVVDDLVQEQLNTALKANEAVLTAEEDVKAIYELTDQLAVAQADMLNQMEAHKYRETIVKKLESLQVLEEAAAVAIRNRMVRKVTEDVVSTFHNDKRVKEAALEQAIAVLAGGAKAKLGKDVVGEAFTASIANYRTNYSKQAAGSDEILVQLEKDVAAIAVAPVSDVRGGNVYETHPIVY